MPVLEEKRRREELHELTIPMSASSLWTYVAVIGSSSAVGTASMNSCKQGRAKLIFAHEISRFRSALSIDPIGLISAEEQSYLFGRVRKVIA